MEEWHVVLIRLIYGINKENLWPVLGKFNTLMVAEKEPIQPVSIRIFYPGSCPVTRAH